MCKKIISLMLVVSALISFSACVSDTETESEFVTETEPVETDLTDTLADQTFSGANFNVLCAAEQWKDYYLVEDQADVLNAARFQMYSEIMERYDIKLEHVIYNGWAAGLSVVKDALSQSVAAGTKDFDLIIGEQSYIYQRVVDCTLADMNNFDIDFSQPWWCSFVNDELQIANKQLLASGYYSLTNLSKSIVTFFNSDLAENYHVADVYDFIDNGTWTYDNMLKCCQAVMDDINGNGVFSINDDVVGIAEAEAYMCQYAVSMGYKFTSRDENDSIIINTENDKLLEISDRIHYLLDNGYSQGDYTNIISSFSEGRTLFLITLLSASDNYEIRNMGNYGLLPLCKYDEKQTEYYTPVFADAAGIPLFVNDEEMSGHILEALNCYSYVEMKDIYLNVVLKEKYAREDNMKRMVDIILKNPSADYAYFLTDSFGGDLFFCTVWKNNLASWLASNYKKLQKTIDDIYETVASY